MITRVVYASDEITRECKFARELFFMRLLHAFHTRVRLPVHANLLESSYPTRE